MTASKKDIPVFDHSFSTFMAGLTIGVAGALLLGTKEGRRLSEKMLSSLTEHLDKQPCSSSLDQIRDFTRDASGNLGKQAQHIGQRVGQVAENIQAATQKFTNPAPPPNIPHNDSGF